MKTHKHKLLFFASGKGMQSFMKIKSLRKISGFTLFHTKLTKMIRVHNVCFLRKRILECI